jgi:AcrR family transcriptional regulator
MKVVAEKPPRWRRRAEARPEEILEAALVAFNERGFDGARMEDIAKRAGLSKAAIYLYFPSKMALLEALIQAKVAPLAAQVERLAAAGKDSPVEALRMVATAAAHKLSDPAVFAVPRLVIGLSGRFPELAKFYRRNVVEKAHAALEVLIDAAIGAGALRGADKDAAVRAFIGPLMFEALWTHVLYGKSAFASPLAMIEDHFDVLLKGLERRA